MKEYEIKFFAFERPLRMKVVAENEQAALDEFHKRVLRNIKVVSTKPTQTPDTTVDDLLNKIFGK